MKFFIFRDIFYDKEDGYIYKFNLVMIIMNGENLSLWIFFFDFLQQEILSLFIGNNKFGMYRFRLIVIDKEGFIVLDDFEVKVLEDINIYNYEFIIDVVVEDSVKLRVIFVETFVNYFGVDFRDVRVRSYGLDVEIVFQFVIRNLICNDFRLLKFSFIMNKKLNENFINVFCFKFVVFFGLYKGLNICLFFKLIFKNNIFF